MDRRALGPAPKGSWNAATGNSAGFQDWKVDLSAYAGKQVEVSITYASDPGTQGLGVFVDGPGIATDHSLYWGFGLEGVTGAATRTQLMKDAMTYFDVTG
jgi:bacillopeptidase F (M6 metalloprotease family)